MTDDRESYIWMTINSKYIIASFANFDNGDILKYRTVFYYTLLCGRDNGGVT